MHIKCAVCADFELCVDCMSAGATVAPHHADHAYRVMDSLAFPLFAADWTAAEELLLLHAIELNGLGNWSEVRGSLHRRALVAIRARECPEVARRRLHLGGCSGVPTLAARRCSLAPSRCVCQHYRRPCAALRENREAKAVPASLGSRV